MPSGRSRPLIYRREVWRRRAGQSLDGTDQLIHRRIVDRRRFARLAARGLGSLLCWHSLVHGREQLGVDVRRLARVRTDKEDQGVVLRPPSGEEAIVAVEMAAAHVIEAGAGQPVSASVATAGHDLFDGHPGGRRSSASKLLQLLAGGRRQRDLDGRLRLPGISSSRSSARTGVSRPAATSSSAWSEQRIVEHIPVPQSAHHGDQQRAVVLVKSDLVEGVLGQGQRVVGDPGRLAAGNRLEDARRPPRSGRSGPRGRARSRLQTLWRHRRVPPAGPGARAAAGAGPRCPRPRRGAPAPRDRTRDRWLPWPHMVPDKPSRIGRNLKPMSASVRREPSRSAPDLSSVSIRDQNLRRAVKVLVSRSPARCPAST